MGEPDAARLGEVRVGNGEPELRLRHPYATRRDAEQAAKAELDRAGRAGTDIEATVAGFRPEFFAGGQIEIAGIKDGIDGRFLIRTVEHSLPPLVTRFTAERSLK